MILSDATRFSDTTEAEIAVISRPVSAWRWRMLSLSALFLIGAYAITLYIVIKMLITLVLLLCLVGLAV